MKKAGIITCCDVNGNYGNKLQNYAVIKLLSKKGIHAQTIITESRKEKNICVFCKIIFSRLLRYKVGKNSQINRIKYFKTKKFENKYLAFSKLLLKGKDISKDYDYFVVGSDQVWNPSWYTDLKKEAFLLTFAKPEQKICIAPSFGISELPDEWKPWFKEHLKSFPKISVREEEGAKIIKELTGKDATVLIDPTLMLDVSEWREISQKPKYVDFNKKYILTYFLGGQSEQVQHDLKKYRKEYDLVEYNLNELNGHYPFASDPSEFIYMIEHAALVVTDSFHACVFSFLFCKPFLVYDREGKSSNMMSRIETLLKKFNLERKYVASGIYNEIFECDYENGYKQLEQERKKFNCFLDESLNGKKVKNSKD